MTLFNLFPGNLSGCDRESQRFPHLTPASLLFFICFNTQECGGPNAASLLSRRR